MSKDVGDNRWPQGKGSVAVTSDCRFILADERRASRTVICHAITRSKRRPFQASGSRNALGLSTAPHTFEPTIELRSKIDNYSAIGISSGDVGLKELHA